jgi:hypothetical protein
MHDPPIAHYDLFRPYCAVLHKDKSRDHATLVVDEVDKAGKAKVTLSMTYIDLFINHLSMFMHR